MLKKFFRPVLPESIDQDIAFYLGIVLSYMIIVALKSTERLSYSVIPIIVLYYFLYKYYVEVRSDSKELWMNQYLNAGGLVVRLWAGNAFTKITSFFSSLILSVIVWVFAVAYSFKEINAVYFALAASIFATRYAKIYVLNELNPIFGKVIYRKYSNAFVMLTVFVVFLLVNVASDIREDYSEKSLLQGATEIKESTHHSVYAVQSVSRMIRYVDFRLLRFRDELQFPIGWLVYLLMLAPCGLPLYGIYAFTISICSHAEAVYLRKLAKRPIAVLVGLILILPGCGVNRKIEEAQKEVKDTIQKAKQEIKDVEAATKEEYNRIEKALTEQLEKEVKQAKEKADNAIRDAEKVKAEAEEQIRLAETQAKKAIDEAAKAIDYATSATMKAEAKLIEKQAEERRALEILFD